MLCHFEAHYYWSHLSAGCALEGLPAVKHGQAPSALVALPVLRLRREEEEYLAEIAEPAEEIINLNNQINLCETQTHHLRGNAPIINGFNHLIVSDINRRAVTTCITPHWRRRRLCGDSRTHPTINNRGAVADPTAKASVEDVLCVGCDFCEKGHNCNSCVFAVD